MKRLASILIAMVLAVTISLPVFGIADPDSGPTIHAVYVFRNVKEPGDMLFFVDETTYYATLPQENAYSAFSVSLTDEDGVTVIGTVPLIVFHTAGYGRNTAILYFTAATCTANSMVWLDNFTISIDGNPTLGWSGAVPSDSITDPDTNFKWSIHINQTLVQSEISRLVMSLAQVLDSEWHTSGTASSLIANTSAGQKLSDVGMAYFASLLPGLNTVAQDAFHVSVTGPDFHKRVYGSGGASALSAQTLLTPFDLTGVATSLGLSVGWLNSILVLALIVGLDYWFIKKQMSQKGIVLIDCVIFILAAIMGVLPLLVVLGGAAVCAFMIINGFFFSKSST